LSKNTNIGIVDNIDHRVAYRSCADFRLSPCLTSRPWKSAHCV